MLFLTPLPLTIFASHKQIFPQHLSLNFLMCCLSLTDHCDSVSEVAKVLKWDAAQHMLCAPGPVQTGMMYFCCWSDAVER